MKIKALSFAIVAFGTAPAMAGVIIHDVMAFPPGPTIIAVLRGMLGW
jgi:hypothetical protein